MSVKCFYCGKDCIAVLRRELSKGDFVIHFQIFVCKKHYLEWFNEKTKEGFK